MIYDDPSVIWPAIPVLCDNVQLFFDDGIIVYGGTNGPFKVNGSKSHEVCKRLFQLLKNNKEKKYSADKIRQILENDGNHNELVYLYDLLFQNGCITFYNSSQEEKYYAGLNSYSKNFSDINDLVSHRDTIKLKVEVSNSEIEEFFINKKINIKTDDFNWKLVQINNTDSIHKLDLNCRNIIFCNTSQGVILGPIVSRDAVSIEFAAEIYSHFNINPDPLDSFASHTVSLISFKLLMRISEYFLDKFFIKIDDLISYESIYDFIDLSDRNYIEQFEIKSAFPACYYNTKKSFLTHYKTKNLMLSKLSYSSPFWKQIDQSKVPQTIMRIFKFLNGFKKSDPRRKYTPTGGNLNSNMLFYANYEPKHFEGIGLYFFDNISNQIFKVNDSAISFNKSQSHDGTIILGSNVDTISEKYGDFGFKVANLNMGVQLATFLMLKNAISQNCSLELISISNEEKLKSLAGMELVNIMFNYGIEVSIND